MNSFNPNAAQGNWKLHFSKQQREEIIRQILSQVRLLLPTPQYATLEFTLKSRDEDILQLAQSPEHYKALIETLAKSVLT
ncbi:hypothetical protein EV182_008150, partial [Spiromyces aspiralis]